MHSWSLAPPLRLKRTDRYETDHDAGGRRGRMGIWLLLPHGGLLAAELKVPSVRHVRARGGQEKRHGTRHATRTMPLPMGRVPCR